MGIEPPLGVRVPDGWERDSQYVEGEHGVLDAIFSPARAFIIEAQENGTREEMWLELVLYVGSPNKEKYIEFTRVRVYHRDTSEPDDHRERVTEEVTRLVSTADILLNLKNLS